MWHCIAPSGLAETVSSPAIWAGRKNIASLEMLSFKPEFYKDAFQYYSCTNSPYLISCSSRLVAFWSGSLPGRENELAGFKNRLAPFSHEPSFAPQPARLHRPTAVGNAAQHGRPGRLAPGQCHGLASAASGVARPQLDVSRGAKPSMMTGCSFWSSAPKRARPFRNATVAETFRDRH
jgi:hypothetical protein